MPRICISIAEKGIEDITTSSKKAKELGADLLELRLDFLKNLDQEKVREVTSEVKKLGLPLILTMRKEGYGGNFPVEKEEKQLMLLLSGANLVDFVDIELETSESGLRDFVNKVKGSGVKVIISSHNLKETPSLKEILRILEKEEEVGADVCKFVSKANKLGDNLRILSANLRFNHQKILFCSGTIGRASRILAPLFGSEFTFASLDKGKETMSGQLDILTTRKILEEIEDD